MDEQQRVRATGGISRRLIFNLLVLIFVSSLPGCDKSTEIQAEDVRNTVNRWLDLWSSYDLDLIPDIFWQSEDLTYFSSEKEGVLAGYSSLLSHHEGFGFQSGGAEPSASLSLADQQITILDDLAIVTAIWYFGDPEDPEVQRGPVTFVITESNSGQVKIAHAHFANYPVGAAE